MQIKLWFWIGAATLATATPAVSAQPRDDGHLDPPTEMPAFTIAVTRKDKPPSNSNPSAMKLPPPPIQLFGVKISKSLVLRSSVSPNRRRPKFQSKTHVVAVPPPALLVAFLPE